MIRRLLFATAMALSLSHPVVAQVPASPDALDELLQRAGTDRAGLGWSPKGWWMRYPNAPAYKLPHFDGMYQQPLATVPFTRTLARSARDTLSREALATPEARQRALALHDFVSNVIDLRQEMSPFQSRPKMAPEGVPLDEAVLAIYQATEQPSAMTTGFSGGVMGAQSVGYPDEEIGRRVRNLPPALSRIIGRLVVDLTDAELWTRRSFRKVSADDRQRIWQRTDMWRALELDGGITYGHLLVFEDVMPLWDEGSLWYASRKTVEALDRARHSLQSLPKSDLASASFDWKSPLGWIRIRSSSNDVIEADDSFLIVDLGGDDRWNGAAGSTSPHRLLGAALDLAGNDAYEADTGAQGAGIAGVGVLIDVSGNDTYRASQFAQGAGQVGFGALFDLGGNDIYRAQHSSQASAAFGVGILADTSGGDRYYTIADGQGSAGPGGVAILTDVMGDDLYSAEPDAKNSGRPGYGSSNSSSGVQGFGGARTGYGAAYGRAWAGGLGGLFDLDGNDKYVAGNWAQGTGYWFGTGLLYDGRGRDQYSGRMWSQGSAAHYAIGVLLDEGGDDNFEAATNSIAFAHDVSIAVLYNKGGNDRYTAGVPAPPELKGVGYGADNSMAMAYNRSPLALFVDEGGDDTYVGRGLHLGIADLRAPLDADADGTGSPGQVGNSTGVNLPVFTELSAYGLFLDIGGKDNYGGRYQDDTVWGETPGTEKWRIRDVGVGMDRATGTINWRPLASRWSK